MSLRYRNIVFEGGGVLGVAYIGALRELNSRGILNGLRGFAGSSVGSIMAAALACRASMDFIERHLKKLDIKSFKDDSYNPAVDAYNLIRNYGFCKGDKLREWCGDILHQLTGNPDVTFKQVFQLYDSVLVITGTSLNRLTTIYFSHITHPNMKVRDAIRISASIPYFFRAIHHNDDVFVDGGVLNNYPLSVFDGNKYFTAAGAGAGKEEADDDGGAADADAAAEYIDDFIRNSNLDTDNSTHDCDITNDPNNRTIGLKLVSSNEVHGDWPRVTNIKSFSTNILEAMMLTIAQGHVRKNDWKRTIKINSGDISSVDFDLSDEESEWLIKQGKDAAIDFLASQDKQSSPPIDAPKKGKGKRGTFFRSH